MSIIVEGLGIGQATAVYVAEEVNIKTEAKVVDPSSYLMLNAPLTHLKCKCQLDNQLIDRWPTPLGFEHN
jgi:hypothetical protein